MNSTNSFSIHVWLTQPSAVCHGYVRYSEHTRAFEAHAGTGMAGYRQTRGTRGVTLIAAATIVLANLVLSPLCLSADEPPPEPGEHLLSAAESEVVLRDMNAAFKSHPTLRAKIRSEIEDLAGKRIEEGDLLLDRGDGKSVRVLRTFSKPKAKAWLLSGATISEFIASQNKVFVKDLSAAPKTVRNIQAAMTGDVKALEALFTIRMFSKPDAGVAKLRLVLDKKPGVSKYVHRQIIARTFAGALFFSEITYIPDEGDELTETFSEIKDAGVLSDADFVLPRADGAERKVEVITE